MAIRRKAAGKSKGTESTTAPWEGEALGPLIDELLDVRQSLMAAAALSAPQLSLLHAAHAAGGANLVHYVALRQRDIRVTQDRLARLGMSSLGRAESHVMANLDKVLGLLHRLCDRPWQVMSDDEPAGYNSARRHLERNTTELLGSPAGERPVRIMVTMPAESANDTPMVQAMVHAGMECARINCAHDDPSIWEAIARNVRTAAGEAGRPCRILMDLGGPKLRTDLRESNPGVLRWNPKRDAVGHVTAPARVRLHPAGHPLDRSSPGESLVGVDGGWLAKLRLDDVITHVDIRGKKRKLTVVGIEGRSVLCAADRTAYVNADTVLSVVSRRDGKPRTTTLQDIATPAPSIVLNRGDHILLVGEETTRATAASTSIAGEPALVGCTLPEALVDLKPGERVYLDDGRIGGVVRRASPGKVLVEIIDARDGGEHLASDKGINLPDSVINVPALTDKDRADLAFAVRHADAIGLSFVHRADDVRCLREALEGLGAGHLGIVLKIENRAAFENLPGLLLEAMRSPSVGLMIARGDLAVEMGYERLAEVQEEILWIAEAAHVPVIWATQVLETMAKTGQPSRAEVTDAAMGVRAECVMLNKGPHIIQAIELLDDILRRMALHQHKKRTMLRQLHSWTGSAEVSPSKRKPRSRTH